MRAYSFLFLKTINEVLMIMNIERIIGKCLECKKYFNIQSRTYLIPEDNIKYHVSHGYCNEDCAGKALQKEFDTYDKNNRK